MASKSKGEFETIWIPLLSIFVPAITMLIVALVGEHENKERGPHDQEPITLTKAVAEASAEAKRAIEQAEGELSCFQQVVGPNIVLTLTATKDHYALKSYLMEESPRSKRLANHILQIYKSFSTYDNPNLKISLDIAGSADANQLSAPLEYRGHEAACSTASGSRTLRNGKATLDNELLGCARAADFQRYLGDGGFSAEIDISGKEFTEADQKTGNFRYISTALTFHNLAALLPDTTFC